MRIRAWSQRVHLWSRQSAITFDLGAAGVRAYQLRQRAGTAVLCDALQFDRRSTGDGAPAAGALVDAVQLERLVGQGRFGGRDVALVASPPDVQFFPLRLPEPALAQPVERVTQALKWEVGQESRAAADDLEVRYWPLPRAGGQFANVMAVVLPSSLALQWCDALQRQRLNLRRIDAMPCALVRLARQVWTPAEHDLWGVLDLGLRHSTLCVVAGTVPAYVRTLSICAADWTRRLADAFQITPAAAERLKRQHAVRATQRGLRGGGEAGGLLQAGDLDSAVSGVLRDALRGLAQEIARCFSYVMQGYPEHGARRLFLAGGGARLAGLQALLEAELELPVNMLASTAAGGPAWEAPLPNILCEPQAAGALGAAMLELEVS